MYEGRNNKYGKCLLFHISDKPPYNNGIIAPPTIAIISNAEANDVCLPNLSIANAHIAPHITELEKESIIRKTNDVIPLVSNAPQTNIKDNIQQ